MASGLVLATVQGSTPGCTARFMWLADAHQTSRPAHEGRTISRLTSAAKAACRRPEGSRFAADRRILCFVQESRSDAAPACRLRCWRSTMCRHPAAGPHFAKAYDRQSINPDYPVAQCREHSSVKIEDDYSAFFWATIEYIMAPGPDPNKTVNCKSKQQTSATKTKPLRSENPFFLLQSPDRVPDRAASFCHLSGDSDSA